MALILPAKVTAMHKNQLPGCKPFSAIVRNTMPNDRVCNVQVQLAGRALWMPSRLHDLGTVLHVSHVQCNCPAALC